MTAEAIGPDEVPFWVPGQLTISSPDRVWDGLSVRGYRYGASDVRIPPLRDYAVVAYQRGSTAMRRKVEGTWSEQTLRPGDVSLLTRAAESHWVWPSDIEVVHVYVSQAELAATCRQMYEREVTDVELRDELKAEDPAVHYTARALAAEAAQGGAGSKLLIDSLSTQLCVHILRHHAKVLFREVAEQEGLTFAQERTVYDYVAAHLHETVSLDDLAGAVGLSRFHFGRCFRRTTGTRPHEFLVAQRVERAKTMLTRTGVPLVDISARCGFADQSHMTRTFKQRVGTTPARYRGHR